jgi:hypothetical protein
MVCALVLAHELLHSGKHSLRDFCSVPLALVQSYRQSERQASNSGSFLVPLSAASSAQAGQVVLAVVQPNVAAVTNKKLDRDMVVLVVVVVVVCGSSFSIRFFSAAPLPPLIPKDSDRRARVARSTSSTENNFIVIIMKVRQMLSLFLVSLS